MRYKPPKFKSLNEMAMIDVSRLTEDGARTILEDIRWPDKKIVCPHCNSEDVTRLHPKSEKIRDGVIQCNKCRKQFTVTVGTIMQGSHITLRQWVQAIYSMCSHKKGVSALQLQRNLGLRSYRSAWYLAHRIRLAMKEEPMLTLLKGTVEVDETYVGGKPRKENMDSNSTGAKRGRGTKKVPVIAMVERYGRVKSKPVGNVSAKTLKTEIKKNVDRESTIMTDEWRSYRGIGKGFKGGHKVVNHGRHEFVNGNVSTNQVESYFALLKRGVHGTFHHISKKHLGRYCDEFAFRWNYRKVKDGERTVEAIKGIVGKRLAYRNLVRV